MKDVEIKIEFDIENMVVVTPDRTEAGKFVAGSMVDNPIATATTVTINGQDEDAPDLITLWIQQVAQEQYDIAAEARAEQILMGGA